MKIAIVQRFLTDYRIPVLNTLLKTGNNSITLFASDVKRMKTNKFHVDAGKCKFKFKPLFPLHLSLSLKNADFILVFFPLLFFSLIKERPDVIITEGESNLPNNLVILLFSKIFRVPYIWWGCGSIKKSIISKLLRPIVWIGIKNASSIIAYNDYAFEYYSATFKIAAKSIFIAYNSIDTDLVAKDIEKYKPMIPKKKKELGIENKTVLVYVGDLSSRKKVDNALQAYNQIKSHNPNIAFIVVGNGTEADNLKSMVENNSISDVFFVGKRVEDVSLYFLLGDIFISPGLGGLSIKHALAHGLVCIIAKDSGGSEEYVIKDGYNGFVVSKDNIIELKERIEILLQDDSLRSQMQKNVSSTVKEKYNIHTMIQEIINSIRFATENGKL